MKYIVYLTINTKSKYKNFNKIYIGVHQTEDPNIFDGYIGNGVYINKPSTYAKPKTAFQYAVKKYGVKSFIRTILYIYDTEEDAHAQEKLLVNEAFIKQEYTYNMSLGGKFPKHISNKKIYQFDLFGNLIKEWQSIKEAQLYYNNMYIQSATNQKMIAENSYWSYDPIINLKEFSKKREQITYVYSKEGKLTNSFLSRKETAEFLKCTPQAISKALKTSTSIKDHYISNSLYDSYVIKPRLKLKNQVFYLYQIEKGLLGQFTYKEIFKELNIHSCHKLDSIINSNNGWYKNYYITNELLDKCPEKIYSVKKINIYTLFGEFIESLPTIKEVKEKYNINSYQMTKILKGIKKHDKYIFEYSK